MAVTNDLLIDFSPYSTDSGQGEGGFSEVFSETWWQHGSEGGPQRIPGSSQPYGLEQDRARLLKFLDFDQNNRLTANDALVAQKKVVEAVREDFAAFRKSFWLDTVNVRPVADGHAELAKGVADSDRNVYLMYVGTNDIRPGEKARGVALKARDGENLETFAYTFAGQIAREFLRDLRAGTKGPSAATFVQHVASTISHEFGHLLGLDHAQGSTAAARSSHMHYGRDRALATFPDQLIPVEGDRFQNPYQEIYDSFNDPLLGSRQVTRPVPKPSSYQHHHCELAKIACSNDSERSEVFAPERKSLPASTLGVLGGRTSAEIAGEFARGLEILRAGALQDLLQRTPAMAAIVPFLSSNALADVIPYARVRLPENELAIPAADSLESLSASLKDAGFHILHSVSDQALSQLAPGQPADLLRVSKTISLGRIRSDTAVTGEALHGLADLSSVRMSGDAQIDTEVFLHLAVGWDTGGFYVVPGILLDAPSAVRADIEGEVANRPFTGFAAASLFSQGKLQTSAADGRIRLNDLSTSQLQVDVSGRAGLGIDANIALADHRWELGGKWHWDLSGGVASLDIRRSGFDKEVVVDRLTEILGTGIQAIQQQATQISNRFGVPPFVGEQLTQSLQTLIAQRFQFDPVNWPNHQLEDQGFEIITVTDPTALLAGTNDQGDLLTVRFRRSGTQPLSLHVQGTPGLGVGRAALNTTLSGPLKGQLASDIDLTLGIDPSGRVYLTEGGKFELRADGSGSVAGQAQARGITSASLDAFGKFQLNGRLLLDDGDDDFGERIYLSSTSSWINSFRTAGLSGHLQLEQALVTVTIPGLTQGVKLAGSGRYDIATQAGSFTFAQDTLLDALAVQAVGHFNEVASQAGTTLQRLEVVPVVGNKVAEHAKSSFPSVQTIPTAGVRESLAARGLKISSLLSPEQLLSGDWNDLIIMTISETRTAPALSFHSAGHLGQLEGIHLDLNAQASLTSSIGLNMAFGLDRFGAFVQEGGSLSAQVEVHGSVQGSAKIPGLIDIRVKGEGAEAQQLAHAALTATVSDFDQVAEERFYLTGPQGGSLTELLAKSEAVKMAGGVDIRATLSTDSPVEQLPQFLRASLRNYLPKEISWSAGLSYDLATQAFDYEVNTASIDKVIAAFSQNDGLEEIVYQLLLDHVAENNPIPKSVQQVLGTQLPILNKNLLDLLEVPHAAQFLISPEEFRDKSMDEMESAQTGNRIDFSFDLLSRTNITNLLSGLPYDIIRVDVDQKFEKHAGSIPILPETVLFSALGLINVTAKVDLGMSFFLGFDLTAGIDSFGFYTLGQSKEAGAALPEPNIKFGGTISAILTGEGDVGIILDLVRVTADVGISAFGGFSFLSPDPDDPKLRGAEVLQAENVVVTAGLDLVYGLKGEVGLLDFGLKAQAEHRGEVELWRHEGETLADLSEQIEEFKENLQDKIDNYALNAVENVVNGAVKEINEWLDESSRKVDNFISEKETQILNWIDNQADAAEAWTKTQLRNLRNWSNSRIDSITRAGSAQIDSLNKVLTTQVDNIDRMLDKSLSRITKKMPSQVRDLVDGIRREMREGAMSVINTITHQIRNAQKQIAEWAKAASNEVLRIVEKTHSYVLRSMESAVSTIVSVAADSTRAIITASAQAVRLAIETQARVLLAAFGTSEHLRQEIHRVAWESGKTVAEVTEEKLLDFRNDLREAKEKASDLIEDKLKAATQEVNRALENAKKEVIRGLDHAKEEVQGAIREATKDGEKLVSRVKEQAANLMKQITGSLGDAGRSLKGILDRLVGNALKEIQKIEKEIKRAVEAARKEADRAARELKAARDAAAREAAKQAAAAKKAVHRAVSSVKKIKL